MDLGGCIAFSRFLYWLWFSVWGEPQKTDTYVMGMPRCSNQAVLQSSPWWSSRPVASWDIRLDAPCPAAAEPIVHVPRVSVGDARLDYSHLPPV